MNPALATHVLTQATDLLETLDAIPDKSGSPVDRGKVPAALYLTARSRRSVKTQAAAHSRTVSLMPSLLQLVQLRGVHIQLHQPGLGVDARFDRELAHHAASIGDGDGIGRGSVEVAILNELRHALSL